MISLIGLILIPVIVAGGFLWATWNAQTRLPRVQAAVVNLDTPVTIDGRMIPLGRQLSGGLVGRPSTVDNLTWVLSDARGAASGLRTGRYVAVVTIPAGFSAAATSFGGPGAQATQATIDVQTSQRSGIADPVIAEAVAAVAADTLNEGLTEHYLDQIYLGLNDVRGSLRGIADGSAQLRDGASQLTAGIESAATGSHTLASGMSQLSAGSAQLTGGTSELASGAAQLADGIGRVDAGLASGPGIDTSQLAALSTGSTRLRTGIAELAPGIAQVDAGAGGLDAGLRRYHDGIAGLADTGLIDPTTGAPFCPPQIAAMGPGSCVAFTEGTKAGAGAAVAGLDTPDPTTSLTLLDGSAGLAAGAHTLATQTAGLPAGVAQLDAGVQQLVAGLGGLSAQLSQLRDGVHALSVGARQLSDGAARLNAGTARYTAGVDQAAAGVPALADGLDQLAEGGRQLTDGIATLSDGVEVGAEQAPYYSDLDRQRLSTVAARPVQSSGQLASLPGGGAVATLLMVLALWLGALATFVVVQAVSARTLISTRSSGALVVRSMAPGIVVALVQAGAVTALGQSVLHLPADTVAAALGVLVLAGVAFVAVNHALVAWLGGPGRVLSVALVVASAAGALTTATPQFFATARPFLPMTPAVDALRAVVTDGAGEGAAITAVVGWAVVGLLAGARRRTTTAEAVLARFG
jgi:putative membrane protein